MFSKYDNTGNLTFFEKVSRINYFFLFLILILFSIGFTSLYSVAGGNFGSWPMSHLIRFSISLFIFFVLIFIDIKIYFRLAYLIFTLSILSLIFVKYFGIESNGATRWISVGGISLQPSEFVKYTLILALAKYFHTIHDEEKGFIHNLFIPLIIILIPVSIVSTQPDLGTAVIIFLCGLSILWIVGINYKFFIAGCIGAILSLPLLWQFLRDYQKERVLTFFNPERDPLGHGYHILQSKIALGSGSMFGKGYMAGTQSHLNFLPEMQTDFIFTMYGEEFGFFGSIFLLSIYMLVVLVGIRMSLLSRSLFGKFLSLGICTVFFIYMFVNIGMVTGLLPVVGVPLPFISYGGSAMLAVMMGFALLMNCYIHQKSILPRGSII